MAVPAETTDIFIIWGDTQLSSSDPVLGPPCIATSRCNDQVVQAQWACDRKVAENIKGVLGVGDIVFNPLDTLQYDNMTVATNVLAGCGIPYVPTFGNHEAAAGGAAVDQPDTASDGTNYWTYYGIPADSRPWFTARGNYEEVAGPGSTQDPAGTNLYLEANNTGARSFWGRFGSRFAVVSAEWELGARIRAASSCGNTSATWGWAQGVMAANPRLVFIHITHDGPCEMSAGAPQAVGCGQWTNTLTGTACDPTRLWKQYRDSNDNALVFLHGHRNENGGGVETNGGGFVTNIVRDSGTNALMGGYDFTFGTRAYNANTSYGWSGRLRWQRAQRNVCLQSIRTVNATVALPAVQTVYPLAAPDIDRPTNSNTAETCVPLVLPLALR